VKAYEVREPTGLDGLVLNADRRQPEASHDQILIRVRAASLNYRDQGVIKGAYGYTKFPVIPMCDGAGEVAAVGPGVTQFKVGDRVASTFFQTWTGGRIPPDASKNSLGGQLDGVLAEAIVLPQNGAIRIPDHLSFEEAATLPCAALTAWHALFEDKPPVCGETVLIQGTGGVSIFALQFAVSAGLRTIVTSSSDEKLARAKQLGATDTINYKTTPNWEEIARKLTRGEGVDRVIEVGGSETLPRSLKAVRMAGTVSVIGVLSGGDATLSPLPLLMNSAHLQGIYVGSRAMFQRMNRAIELNRIKPVIDKMFEWTEIKQALEYLGNGQHFGKICLRWS
jgi:NADPH:quinone reductase-like Zn-dependent oxidoreductase